MKGRNARLTKNFAKRDYKYYIFCEGTKTEPDYFKNIIRHIER